VYPANDNQNQERTQKLRGDIGASILFGQESFYLALLPLHIKPT